MIRKLMTAGALALATAAPANAATFSVSFSGSPLAVVGNDFASLLGALTSYVSTGAGISLDSAASVDFFYLGSESAYNNTFTAGSVSLTETADANNFASPVFIGSEYYAGGAVTGWTFTSNVGPSASIGQNGFGIFLASSATSPVTGLTSLIIGYDDQQVTPDDDNHDDFVILAQISAVPEASTWAMLIAGFVTVGAAMRRRSSLRLRQAV